MKWIFDDGGRAASGRRGSGGDCVVRAIAIATGRDYDQVFDDLKGLAAAERITKRQRTRSSVANGVRRNTIMRYLVRDLGWSWTPTMGIGTGCRVHVRDGELPAGTLILNLSKHVTAVVDGTIRDLYDPSREGTRCVYGYWQPPQQLDASRAGP